MTIRNARRRTRPIDSESVRLVLAVYCHAVAYPSSKETGRNDCRPPSPRIGGEKRFCRYGDTVTAVYARRRISRARVLISTTQERSRGRATMRTLDRKIKSSPTRPTSDAVRFRPCRVYVPNRNHARYIIVFRTISDETDYDSAVTALSSDFFSVLIVRHSIPFPLTGFK